MIDNVPWYRGALITHALQEFLHLELYRLPSDSPHLQVIKRFWRVLRRRAIHKRLFLMLAQLKHALRNNLRYDQALKHRVLSLIQLTQLGQVPGRDTSACYEVGSSGHC